MLGCCDQPRGGGGYSVFIGRNNAVLMYFDGWIDGRGRDRGKVFMTIGRSSFGAMWVLALSCCINIGRLRSDACHFDLMAGRTLFINHSLLTSFVTDITSFVTIVPARQ